MFKKGDKLTLNSKYYKNIDAYVIGKNKSFFENQLKNKINFKCFTDLKKAILVIKNKIKKNTTEKTILFSPAAASFDQFKNFEHRGSCFNSLVKKINFYGK